jgi:hypothetical protein
MSEEERRTSSLEVENICNINDADTAAQNINRINFLKREDYNIKNKYYVHIEESVL